MQITTANFRRLDTGHKLDSSVCSPSSRTLIETVSKANLCLYQGFFGHVNMQQKSKFIRGSRGSRIVNQKALTEESLVTIWPSFMKFGFELRFVNSFGRIPRTLNIYPIMPRGSQVFRMDLEELQVAFSNGSVSPYVLNPDGMSLLHVSISSRIVKLN